VWLAAQTAASIDDRCRLQLQMARRITMSDGIDVYVDGGLHQGCDASAVFGGRRAATVRSQKLAVPVFDRAACDGATCSSASEATRPSALI